MDVYRQLNAIHSLESSVLTIGTFDGLHRGHQEIVKKVTTIAQANKVPSVLITFDPHPRHVLDPENTLPMILSIDEKLKLLTNLHLDIVVIIPFDVEFSKMSAENFLQTIVAQQFHPRHVVIGYDHHFGYRREGSPEYLFQYGNRHGFTVEIVEPVHDENVIISSTHIRRLIQEGYVRRASFELGWVYGFPARVVHGSGRGRRLEFPTANFLPIEKMQLLPKNGVYLTRGRIDGNNLYGMCNLGVRPTFGEGDFVMEVHFFHKQLVDLYDREIRVEFLERIRDEKKFVDADHLKQQLRRDRRVCMQLLAKYQ